MEYLCPKCKSIMQCFSTASIPPIIRYECFECGYMSKPIKEHNYVMMLPADWRGEDEKDDSH